jgi:hypothetical protein
MEESAATAEGDLGRTPLAHLLVYALDRQLTGALFLGPPPEAGAAAAEHVVRLEQGVPVKVCPGDRHALLGEMLIEAGAIDAPTLEAALATKGLLGDVLLLAGRVDQDVLEKVAEQQFVRRMVRLFSLPAATVYRYYDGHEALADHGAGPARVDPLALIWAGLREHGEASTMLESTVARLGAAPLRLHAATTVRRFALDDQEVQVCELLKECPLTVAEIVEASSPETARRLAYLLAITRQLDLGGGAPPLGADPVVEVSRIAPAPTAFARMSLRSTVHRQGAAAPDLPGDGERVTIRRERAAGDGGGEPPSSRQGEPPSSSERPVPPESGVVSVATPPVTAGTTPTPPQEQGDAACPPATTEGDPPEHPAAANEEVQGR